MTYITIPDRIGGTHYVHASHSDRFSYLIDRDMRYAEIQLFCVTCGWTVRLPVTIFGSPAERHPPCNISFNTPDTRDYLAAQYTKIPCSEKVVRRWALNREKRDRARGFAR